MPDMAVIDPSMSGGRSMEARTTPSGMDSMGEKHEAVRDDHRGLAGDP